MRGGSDDQASRRRRRLEPRRSVDDIAGRQRPAVLSGVQGDERVAGVHGRTRGQIEGVLAIELVDPFENAQAGADCALRVVSVRDRCAEHGHDSVADELLEHASVLLDLPLRARVVELQGVAHVFGIGLVGARGEPDEIDEQDGHELPLLTGRGCDLEPRAAVVAEA